MRLAFNLLLLLSITAHAQYDAPGIDPVWHYHSQPNAYAHLANGANINTVTNPRTEYYTNAQGVVVDSAKWNKTGNWLTISGRGYTPTQLMLGIDKLHTKGYIGTGVKIYIIDGGYSNNIQHQSIGAIAGSYNNGNFVDSTELTTNIHTTQCLSIAAAKPSRDSSRLIGSAYGANFYSVSYADLVDGFRFINRTGKGIVCIPRIVGDEWLTGDLGAAFRAEVAAFQRMGGIVIISAGQGPSYGAMQNVCGWPGIVCVASSIGGTVLNFTDSCRDCKIQPVNGKPCDFLLPHYTIAAGFDNGDGFNNTTGGAGHDNCYSVVGGASYSIMELAGKMACEAQKFPRLTPRAIYQLELFKSRTVINAGYVGHVPRPIK